MKKLLVLLLAVAMCFAFAACGGDDAVSSEAGTYKCISMTDENGETIDEDTMAMMDALGLSVLIVLNEDGTGYIDMGGGELAEFTYGNGEMIAEGDAITYEIDGDILTLDGGSMVFERQDGDVADNDSDADVEVEDGDDVVSGLNEEFTVTEVTMDFFTAACPSTAYLGEDFYGSAAIIDNDGDYEISVWEHYYSAEDRQYDLDEYEEMKGYEGYTVEIVEGDAIGGADDVVICYTQTILGDDAYISILFPAAVSDYAGVELRVSSGTMDIYDVMASAEVQAILSGIAF